MSPAYRPFAGHPALVTGSTSGIGLGIAEVLAAAGAAAPLAATLRDHVDFGRIARGATRLDFTPAGIRARREAGLIDAREVIALQPWKQEVPEHEGVIVHDHLSNCSTA